MWPLADKPRRQVWERITPTFGNSLENPSTPLSAAPAWLSEAVGGAPTFAGAPVSETSAMRQTAVFSCVAIKAGVMAALPLTIYQHTDNGKKEAVNHRLYPLLARDPNDLMTGFTWKELIFSNLMLAGNHYSVIEYDNAARVIGLLPVMPQTSKVERVNGRNRYTFRLSDGTDQVLDQEDVLHIPGIGFDGMKGLSPIQWAGRQPIGIALALEEFTGRIHSQGIRSTGQVTLPPKITKEGIARLRAEIEDLYTGNRNAGRPLILDHGATWNSMQLTMEDTQTLESRRFQVADICRLFRVPPFLVGESVLLGHRHRADGHRVQDLLD